MKSFINTVLTKVATTVDTYLFISERDFRTKNLLKADVSVQIILTRIHTNLEVTTNYSYSTTFDASEIG